MSQGFCAPHGGLWRPNHSTTRSNCLIDVVEGPAHRISINQSTIIHFYLPIGCLLKMNNSWQTDPIAISPGPRAESSALNPPLLIGPLALHNAPFYGCVRSWIFGSEKSSMVVYSAVKVLFMPLNFIQDTAPSAFISLTIVSWHRWGYIIRHLSKQPHPYSLLW